eukprot:5560310-Pleurochrysis_carterae.AAC.1
MLLYSAARVVELWPNWQQSHGRGSLSPGRGECVRMRRTTAGMRQSQPASQLSLRRAKEDRSSTDGTA